MDDDSISILLMIVKMSSAVRVCDRLFDRWNLPAWKKTDRMRSRWVVCLIPIDTRSMKLRSRNDCGMFVWMTVG